MADDTVTLNVGSGGKLVDASSLTVGANTVDRQRIVIADDATAGGLAKVGNTPPVGTEYGLNVRPIETDLVATGTITATDAVVAAPGGAGAFVTGASTAGSTVFILTSGGDSAWNVQITGLTSGTLYFEGSIDSTTGADGNWINVNGRQTGVVNTVLAGNATANGLYRGNTSGLKYFRVRSVGTLTGTPAIRIVVSDGTGAIFLNASVPAGTNAIGAVRNTDAAGVNVGAVGNAQPATTDYGLVTRQAGDMLPWHSAASIAGPINTTVGSQIDTSGYNWALLEIRGTFSAQLQIQFSDDNTTWTAGYVFATGASQPTTLVSTITSVGQWWFPIRGRYARLQITSFTSNTSSAVNTYLRNQPQPIEFINVNVPGTVSTVASPSATTATSTTYATTAFVKAAASTNATSVKATAGSILSLALVNTSAAARYFKLYNKATAPVVGTDVPVALFVIPAGGNITIDGNSNGFPKFATGIAYSISTGVADTDATATAVNDVSGWVIYW